MLKMSGGNLAKAVRVNPYKRPKTGTEVTFGVNGEEVVGLIPPKGKYTYLTLGDTEFYVTAELEEGQSYEVVDEPVKPKKAKKPAAEAEAD